MAQDPFSRFLRDVVNVVEHDSDWGGYSGDALLEPGKDRAGERRLLQGLDTNGRLVVGHAARDGRRQPGHEDKCVAVALVARQPRDWRSRP
jgi:hypothetical protein